MPLDPAPMLILATQRAALTKRRVSRICRHGDHDDPDHTFEELVLRMMMKTIRIGLNQSPNIANNLVKTVHKKWVGIKSPPIFSSYRAL